MRLQDNSTGFIFIPLMSSPNNIFVIVPAYNESTTIGPVVQELLSFGYTPVVVDDGSSDNVEAALKGMTVYLLRHPVNLGQGAALQTGILYACSKGASHIITFDADGQHDVNDIKKLIEALTRNDLDIVLGSRFLKGSEHNMPARRKWLLQLARYFNYLFTGLLLSDAHNGLRALTCKAASSLRITENRMAHATQLLGEIKRKRLKYGEVPVTIHYTDYSRKKGQKSWSSFRIIFDILLNKIFK